VSGAGDIKLTKDGNVLLHEMVSVTCNVNVGMWERPGKLLMYSDIPWVSGGVAHTQKNGMHY